MKPNVLSYSGVISCIAQNTQHRMDASHGEEILRRMEVRQENVTGDLKPDNGGFFNNEVCFLYCHQSFNPDFIENLHVYSHLQPSHQSLQQKWI